MTDLLFDPVLERDVIASVLWFDDDTFQTVTDHVRSSDFNDGLCSRLFSACEAIHARGEKRTWLTVAARAGVPSGQVQALLDGANRCSTTTVRTHAQQLADLAARRRLSVRMGEIIRRGHEPDCTLDELHRLTQAALDDDRLPDPVERPMRACDLAEMEFSYDWLVPNLLERGDRVVLTGAEGAGKSELLRQIAVMLAAGLHPFTRVTIARARVLIIDLENSRPQLARSLKRLLTVAGDSLDDHLVVESRQQGIDLRAPADVRWLDAVLTNARPDVVVFGPLYRAFRTRGRETKNDENAAEEAALALDRLRVRHRCALLIEAHSPHGESGNRANWRPYGASLWLRWPEMGFGLKPLPDREVELALWRGMRDRDRRWPRYLAPGHRWPWESIERKDRA